MIDPHALGIEVRHLRYFLAVFEELHFGRAALRLGITRRPLARAIQALEVGLGVALFRRSRGRLTPTAAAEAFALESRSVLTRLELAVVETRRVAAAVPRESTLSRHAQTSG